MSYQEEIKKIAKWMKNYADKASSDGFVVGLSGGIDSSVIAYLAVKAVGKEKVIGISLPCQTREDMKDDAVQLAENLGITFEQIFLDETFKTLTNGIFVDYKNSLIQTLTLANIKARLRMTALYAVANQNNLLVAGTGNKSELMVGYFTKYGDGGVDLEPLGEYYKRQVYAMADLMPEIPDRVKTKAPSADLYEGQTDEQELGMTYDKLEKVLIRCEQGKNWIDLYTKLDVITKEEFIKVKDMINKSIHKNEVPPKYARK